MARKLGGWLCIMLAWAMLAGLYFTTPYLLHSASRVVNFLELCAVGIAVGLGVLMLAAGVVMRKPGSEVVRPPRKPPTPSVAAPDSYAMMLTTAQGYLKSADEAIQKIEATSPTHSALWNLSLALSALLTMIQIAARSQEGTKAQ